MALLLSRRPGGWDTNVAVDVIGQTDDNLVEAIGVLGWLDTLVPWFAVFLWLIADRRADWRGAAVRVAERWAGPGCWPSTTVATSWVFELYQGKRRGHLLAGALLDAVADRDPMLLTLDADRAGAAASSSYDESICCVVGGALLILNIAAWAAARRFGVGTRGSHLPWRWGLDPTDSTDRAADRPRLPSVALLMVVLSRRGQSPDVADR